MQCPHGARGGREALDAVQALDGGDLVPQDELERLEHRKRRARAIQVRGVLVVERRMLLRARDDERGAPARDLAREVLPPAPLGVRRLALRRAVHRARARRDLRPEPVLVVRGLDAEVALDVPRGAHQLRGDQPEARAAAHGAPASRLHDGNSAERNPTVGGKLGRAA